MSYPADTLPLPTKERETQMETCKVHPFVNVTDPAQPTCMVCGAVVPDAKW